MPDAPPARNRRLLLVLAALGVVSAVIAGVVIFSSGGSAPPQDPVARVRVSGESLVLGLPSALTTVVVFEDFGGRASREFEIASRDFLEVEAAQDNVRVEYHPFPLTDGYSQDALEAWGAVAAASTPKQAMAYRDLLFDRQPATGSVPTADELESWAVQAGAEPGVVSQELASPGSAFVDSSRRAARAAGVALAPTVMVDGKPLDPANGTELADQLQRRILEESRWRSNASSAG